MHRQRPGAGSARRACLLLGDLHSWLPRPLQLCVEGVTPRLGTGWLHEVEIEELFQYVERPFCLLGPHLDNLACTRGLQRVGRKIPDVANRVQVLC